MLDLLRTRLPAANSRASDATSDKRDNDKLATSVPNSNDDEDDEAARILLAHMLQGRPGVTRPRASVSGLSKIRRGSDGVITAVAMQLPARRVRITG